MDKRDKDKNRDNLKRAIKGGYPWLKQNVALILSMVVLSSLLSSCKNIGTLLGSDDTRAVANQYDLVKDQILIEGNKLFAIELFKEIARTKEGENLFISPYSISSAIGMAYNGAKGNTKDEIANILGIGEISDEAFNSGSKYLLQKLNKSESATIKINNSIWIRDGFEVNKDFIDKNIEVFDAYIKPLDFSEKGAAETINNWIDKKTEHLINNIIEPPIDPLAQMFIINTIYFNGKWKIPFELGNTRGDVFYNNKKEETTVPMMNMKESQYYMESDTYQAIKLQYIKGTTYIYLILPKESENLSEIIKNITIEELNNIVNGMKLELEVRLQLPKFKLEYGPVILNEELKNLGMKEAFAPKLANLTDVYESVDDNLYISRILHKAVIEVDETGTVAAAVTVEELKTESAMEVEDPKTFIANRPFMFMIYDEVEEVILFMGTLVDIEPKGEK